MSSAASSDKPRLAAIDGFRALAVFGVIWWHTWIHSGNPALFLSLAGHKINLERCLVILGTGFNLFFVISGFCIRLSLEHLVKQPTWENYRRFLLRRWLRLSPLFYVACCVLSVVTLAGSGLFPFKTLLAHLLWIFGWVPGVWPLAPQFWTLQVEWEFYLTLPLLFLALRSRNARLLGLVVLAAASLGWRLYIHAAPGGIAGRNYGHLPAHFTEFVWGVLLAEAWLGRVAAPRYFSTGWFALISFFLAYAGRGLMSTESYRWAGANGFVAKAISEPLLGLGFALLIASAMAGNRFLNFILSLWPVQFIGRISYSLYVWHWYPALWLGHWLRNACGVSPAAHYAALFLTLAVTVPLSCISYRWLELPFMHARTGNPKAAAASAQRATAGP